MELTVNDALQKAIKAQKAGMFREAYELYTEILKAQPNHPDSNHNMGVLSVKLGKLEDSIPFFKKALNTKPSIFQFWLSMINVLIRLKRTDEAKALLDQAKEKGVEVKTLKKLKQELSKLMKLYPFSNVVNSENVKPRTNILDSLKLEQALKLAKKISKDGNTEEAKCIYQDILIKFSKNKKAIAGLKELADNYLNLGNALQIEGKFKEAIETYKLALSINYNKAIIYNNLGIALDAKGYKEKAIISFKKALSIKPDYADCYANIGNTLIKEKKIEEAIKALDKAVSINPNNANYYNSMGNAFHIQGNFSKSVIYFKKALSLIPNNADCHANLSNSLQLQGNFEEAIKVAKKAISINPNHAIALYNMGNALHAQGLLEDAVKVYNKALSIKSNFVECYANIGNVLQDQGKMEQAVHNYKNALSIDPLHISSLWGLSGTAKNINEAKNWIKYCLKADQNHEKARLTLSALEFYEGNKSEFNSLMQSSLRNHPYLRSFSWVFNLPKLPKLFFNRWALFDHIVHLSNQERPFYEFGVWRGTAFRYLIKTFKKGYGFDSFQGLPEGWHNEGAGTYSSSGVIPQIDGGEFIVGKFEDTLPDFFSKPRPIASLINFDADLYSSTIFALNCSKKIIDQNTILIFDEFLINDYWEQDEYKALNEFCLNNKYTYEVIAISFFTKQVAVRLIDN